MQADRQTNRHTHHNSLYPSQGQSNNRNNFFRRPVAIMLPNQQRQSTSLTNTSRWCV